MTIGTLSQEDLKLAGKLVMEGGLSVGEALDQIVGQQIVAMAEIMPAPEVAPVIVRVPVAQPGSDRVHAAWINHFGTPILTCGTARGSLCETTDRAVSCSRCLLDMSEGLF